ncbi:hypothetical protein TrCOL_g13032 [Triparma columacea]|uniref:gamma-glutamylcyclotransferase n=1 Tax=Triparma columacea TaxID=722753 RepID=A0A9W7G987_9STRA|nr:hypothetical protein TrCOL_g13032 [Triparma columacea]
MAGIYPSPNSTIHGALATLPREDYENLWMSEGGGMDKPSYEEVEVECYKYNEVTPVKAIAFMARPHARLKNDGDPSRRYMRMLINGASELGLEQEYQKYLKDLVTDATPRYLRMIAINHLFLTSWMFRTKKRTAARVISNAVNYFYLSSGNSTFITRRISQLLQAIVLLPGALVGSFIRAWGWWKGREVNGMMKIIIDDGEEGGDE